MNSKINVLQINKFFYLKGGSERYFFSLSDLLTTKKINVSYFSMNDKNNFTSIYSEFFLKPIDFYNHSAFDKLVYAINAIYSVTASKKLQGLINKFAPNIAHLHLYHHHMSPSIVRTLRKNDIPVVYTAHDLKLICPNYKMLNKNKVCEKCKTNRYYYCTINKCIKNSLPQSIVVTIEMYLHYWIKTHDLINIIITPSKFYYDKFIEYGYEKNKLKYIPNFVDLDNYKPNFEHKNYCLYFGRLSEEKGLITLIEAAKKTKCQLIIAGTGPIENEIRKKMDQDQINNVKLVGYKTGDELKELICNSRFVVVPSEWYENAPYSILEANAYGKPVIASKIGGLPEMVDDGYSGLLFEPGNSEELAEKINYLYNNPGKIIEFGKSAREKVEINNNKEIHYEKIMEVYNSLLK